jgi:hypothetical protein
MDGSLEWDDEVHFHVNNWGGAMFPSLTQPEEAKPHGVDVQGNESHDGDLFSFSHG